MRLYIWSVFAFLALGVACWGCAGGLDRAAKTDAPSLTLPNDQRYVKRVGLGVIHEPSTELGRESARRFAQSVAATMQGQMARLKLLKAWEDKTIKEAIDLLKSNTIDVVAARWRTDGFQGIATAALLDVRLVTEKTGIFWFRKDRYFVKFEVVLDLYDTHSGAKLVNEVTEMSLKISQEDYEALQSGTVLHISDLDESLTDLANEFGEEAAEAMRKHPWQTSIISTDAEGIFLAAGRSSGLQVGDRLVIYSGNRLITGESGKYVLPGMKIAEVDIKQVAEHRSNAVVLQNGTVQVGDIAMPMGRNP
jgi:hypothetical protein